MRILNLVALACCVAVAAQAEVRPKVLPDRDVAVTYSSGSATERVVYSASQGIFRRWHDGKPAFVLMNTRDGTTHLVTDQHRAFVLAKGGLFDGPFPWDKRMHFRKLGQDTVAGLACTEWQLTLSGGQGASSDEPGRACLTADGIILRYGTAESGDVATSVVYGAQDPAAFRIPPGYRKLSMAEAMQLQ